MRLAGKVALVTGGARGIGLACAAAFAGEGARVVVADRDAAAGAEAVRKLCSAGREALFVEADVAVPAAVEGAVRQTVTAYGHLDTLVCSAGVGGRRFGDGPVETCTLEAWDAVMQVNLRGTFLALKYALPELRRGGGSVVTVSSVLGLVGTQGLFDTHAYAASKAGIVGLTRAVAAHYARDRVRANALAPGLIDTAMAGRTKGDPALLAQVAFWQPLGPLGAPEDVAGAAVFLASDEAKFITGAVLPVDGGWTAQ